MTMPIMPKILIGKQYRFTYYDKQLKRKESFIFYYRDINSMKNFKKTYRLAVAQNQWCALRVSTIAHFSTL